MDYYPLSDLLYRSVALTDESKGVCEAYDTDAYGNTLVFADTDPHRTDWFTDADANHITVAPICRFIFTGREKYDPETEIYFYRARYYQAQLGRPISRDTLGYSAGPSLYEYATSAPLRRLDLSGAAPTESGTGCCLSDEDCPGKCQVCSEGRCAYKEDCPGGAWHGGVSLTFDAGFCGGGVVATGEIVCDSNGKKALVGFWGLGGGIVTGWSITLYDLSARVSHAPCEEDLNGAADFFVGSLGWIASFSYMRVEVSGGATYKVWSLGGDFSLFPFSVAGYHGNAYGKLAP
jgi:RHS repeat-associated protein